MMQGRKLLDAFLHFPLSPLISIAH